MNKKHTLSTSIHSIEPIPSGYFHPVIFMSSCLPVLSLLPIGCCLVVGLFLSVDGVGLLVGWLVGWLLPFPIRLLSQSAHGPGDLLPLSPVDSGGGIWVVDVVCRIRSGQVCTQHDAQCCIWWCMGVCPVHNALSV